MAIRPKILGEAPVALWGVASRDRLLRQLTRAGAGAPLGPHDPLGPEDTVLAIRADYLYDPRVLRALVETGPATGLRGQDDLGAEPLAIHVAAEQDAQAEDVLEGRLGPDSLGRVTLQAPGEMAGTYQAGLSKAEEPYALPIRPDNAASLEDRLFHSSYKGVTDLVTKFLWPRPSRWATRASVRLGLKPNHVTLASLILAIAVIGLFAYGFHGWGLALGWVMTFLDTLDGKLARVTSQTSRIGDALDHGLDLIHPPLWYIAWGVGLEAATGGILGLSLATIYALIVAGYILGRVAEGAFTFWLAPFQIFTWRPVDSWFRLVAARRNPNLLLLSASAIVGRPDWGLAAVTVWTLACTVFLGWRLAAAIHSKRKGPLRPWLADIQPDASSAGLTERVFAHRSTPSSTG